MRVGAKAAEEREGTGEGGWTGAGGGRACAAVAKVAKRERVLKTERDPGEAASCGRTLAPEGLRGGASAGRTRRWPNPLRSGVFLTFFLRK